MAKKKSVKYGITALDGSKHMPVMIDEANTPLGAKRKANAMIRELGREGNNDAQVYVSWHRIADGRAGYLNRDGKHEASGKNWRRRPIDQRQSRRKKR